MPAVKSIEVDGGDATIHIWSVTEDSEELQILCDECGVEYSEQELDLPEHRLVEILATRLLIHSIYGENVRILHHENGAPYIVDGDYISVSHTKGAVVIAVSQRGFVGVDIESISPRVLRIKDKFINEGEREFIAEDDVPHVLMAWCAKEALFKAIPDSGIDFRENLLLERFTKDDTRFNARFVKGETDDRYQLHSYKHENYIIIFAELK